MMTGRDEPATRPQEQRSGEGATGEGKEDKATMWQRWQLQLTGWAGAVTGCEEVPDGETIR